MPWCTVCGERPAMVVDHAIAISHNAALLHRWCLAPSGGGHGHRQVSCVTTARFNSQRATPLQHCASAHAPMLPLLRPQPCWICMAVPRTSHLQALVAVMGCLPVVVSDLVMQPFEPEMDWSAFSLRVEQKDVPTMHEAIEAVDEQVSGYRARLWGRAQKVAYAHDSTPGSRARFKRS